MTLKNFNFALSLVFKLYSSKQNCIMMLS